MLKIFTEHQLLDSDNRKRVFPLLFDLVYVPNPKTILNFGLTDSILEADLIIFPVDIVSFLKNDHKNFFNNWLETVVQYNKPIWLYAAGDFGLSLKKENVFTFRFGGFNSKLDNAVFILPSFINDPYATILKNDFYLLSKEIKPTLGFVGNANNSLMQVGKEFILYIERNWANFILKNPLDYHPFYSSGRKRYQLLNKIVKDVRIQSNFIFRRKYRAKEKNIGTKESTTLEFFKSIQDNLYVFCLRGNGNFSVRFYEALIMGRIPVLVDTDVRLPLSDEIDWNKHCLIVSEDSLLEDLVKFHSTKTDLELKEIQTSNRKLMLEKLNRIDYFIHLSQNKFDKK